MSDLIERLRALALMLHDDASIGDEAAEEIERLRAELSACREDAERYRWLRGGKDIPLSSHRWARWEVRYWCGRWWNTLLGEEMDKEVDAARKA